jgi:acetyl-CoA carboxylase alpha subunit
LIKTEKKVNLPVTFIESPGPAETVKAEMRMQANAERMEAELENMTVKNVVDQRGTRGNVNSCYGFYSHAELTSRGSRKK